MNDRKYVKVNTSIQTGSNADRLSYDSEGNVKAVIDLNLPADLFPEKNGPKKIDSVVMQTSKMRLSMSETPIAQFDVDTDLTKEKQMVILQPQLDVYPFVYKEGRIVEPLTNAFKYYKSHQVDVTIRLYEDEENYEDYDNFIIYGGVPKNFIPPRYRDLFEKAGISDLGKHYMNLIPQETRERLNVENGQLLVRNVSTIEQMLQDALQNAITFASFNDHLEYTVKLISSDYMDASRLDPTPDFQNSIVLNDKKYFFWEGSSGSLSYSDLDFACKPRVSLNESSMTISYDSAAFKEIVPVIWNSSFVDNEERPLQFDLDKLRFLFGGRERPPKRFYKYDVNSSSSGYNFVLNNMYNCALMNIIANKSLRDAFSFLPWIEVDVSDRLGIIIHEDEQIVPKYQNVDMKVVVKQNAYSLVRYYTNSSGDPPYTYKVRELTPDSEGYHVTMTFAAPRDSAAAADSENWASINVVFNYTETSTGHDNPRYISYEDIQGREIYIDEEATSILNAELSNTSATSSATINIGTEVVANTDETVNKYIPLHTTGILYCYDLQDVNNEASHEPYVVPGKALTGQFVSSNMSRFIPARAPDFISVEEITGDLEHYSYTWKWKLHADANGKAITHCYSSSITQIRQQACVETFTHMSPQMYTTTHVIDATAIGELEQLNLYHPGILTDNTFTVKDFSGNYRTPVISRSAETGGGRPLEARRGQKYVVTAEYDVYDCCPDHWYNFQCDLFPSSLTDPYDFPGSNVIANTEMHLPDDFLNINQNNTLGYVFGGSTTSTTPEATNHVNSQAQNEVTEESGGFEDPISVSVESLDKTTYPETFGSITYNPLNQPSSGINTPVWYYVANGASGSYKLCKYAANATLAEGVPETARWYPPTSGDPAGSTAGPGVTHYVMVWRYPAGTGIPSNNVIIAPNADAKIGTYNHFPATASLGGELQLAVPGYVDRETENYSLLPNLNFATSGDDKFYILDGTSCEVNVGETEPIADPYYDNTYNHVTRTTVVNKNTSSSTTYRTMRAGSYRSVSDTFGPWTWKNCRIEYREEGGGYIFHRWRVVTRDAYYSEGGRDIFTAEVWGWPNPNDVEESGLTDASQIRSHTVTIPNLEDEITETEERGTGEYTPSTTTTVEDPTSTSSYTVNRQGRKIQYVWRILYQGSAIDYDRIDSYEYFASPWVDYKENYSIEEMFNFLPTYKGEAIPEGHTVDRTKPAMRWSKYMFDGYYYEVVLIYAGLAGEGYWPVTINDCVVFGKDTTNRTFQKTTTEVIEANEPQYKSNVRLSFTWNNLPMVVLSPISSIVLTLTGMDVQQEYQPINMTEVGGSSLTSSVPVIENYFSLAQTLRDLHDELVVVKEQFDTTATYTLSTQSGQERSLTLSAHYISKDGKLHQIYIPPNGVFTLQLTFAISYYYSS